MLNVIHKIKSYFCFDKINSKYKRNSNEDQIYDDINSYSQYKNHINRFNSNSEFENADYLINNINSINLNTNKDFIGNLYKNGKDNSYKDIYQESKSDEESDDSHEKYQIQNETNILILIPLSYLFIHLFTLVYLLFIRVKSNIEVKSDLLLKDIVFRSQGKSNSNSNLKSHTDLIANELLQSDNKQHITINQLNKSSIDEYSKTFNVDKVMSYLIELKDNIKFSKIYDFYSLIDNDKEFVFVSYTINSIISLIILYLIFSLLKQRFNVPEYKLNHYNLYAMFLLGFFSVILNFMIGFYPFYVKQNFTISIFKTKTEDIANTFGEYSNEAINSRIDFQSLISLKILLYTSFIVISILYALSVIVNVNFLKKISNINTGSKTHENIYFKYFFLLLNWCLSAIYIFLLINKSSDKSLYLDDSRTVDVVFALIPYFLYILHGVIMFCFYYDIKYVTYNMKKNIYVDFLFENESIELLDEDGIKFSRNHKK